MTNQTNKRRDTPTEGSSVSSEENLDWLVQAHEEARAYATQQVFGGSGNEREATPTIEEKILKKERCAVGIAVDDSGEVLSSSLEDPPMTSSTPPTRVGAVPVMGPGSTEIPASGIESTLEEEEVEEEDNDPNDATAANLDFAEEWLAIAAEVAPDALQLEETIAARIQEQIESNAAVAEIVDPSKQRRRTIMGGSCLLLVAVAIGVVLALEIAHDIAAVSPPARALPPNETVLATIPELICYERLPTMGFSQHCDPQPLGGGANNLLAISRLWNVPEADFSLSNGGEARTDLVSGNFTVLDLRSFLPFGDETLALVNVTGKALLTAMERALQKIFDDHVLEEASKSMGSYPYLAGMVYDVNMTEPSFQRITNVLVNPQLNYSSWKPMNLTHTYRVVTNAHLANGGDSYHDISYFVDELEYPANLAFADYAQHVQELGHPTLEEYSTQSYIHDNRLDCQHKGCL
jgi:5'-nucleotidase, C-terminal domain